MCTRNKKSISFITSFLLIFSLIASISIKRVHAYSNPSVFRDIRVGLVTMSNPSLTGVLNGNYTLNGTILASGTTINIKLSNGFININGVDYSDPQLLPLSEDNLFSLTSGTTTLKYLGKFSFKVVSGKILPVNALDLESYLKGVVGYEMSDYYPVEALKAQAVAARNYALSRLGSESAKGYDFDDTTLYQTYKGYDSTQVNTLKAVNETKWTVLLYNDSLVETMYSAWHGGYSEDSVNVWGNSTPYLKSKPDPYENAPWPNGSVVLSNSQIDSALKTKGYLLSTDSFVQLDLASITRYVSYRVSNINIIYKDSLGITRTKSVIKDKARTFLSLPSSMFDVVYNAAAGTYSFSGKGFGHGLGMSQIGAKNRASSGQSYDTILKFYYDGAYLENLTPRAILSTMNLSTSQVYTQETVNISAQGSGGSGQYLYKYQIALNGTIVYNSDYTTQSSTDYQPIQPGTYEIRTFIKDKFSQLTQDDNQVKYLTVIERPVALITGVTKSLDRLLVNQPILIQASGSDSSLYKFDVLLNNILIQSSDFNINGNFTYIPSVQGEYTVNVYSRHQLSLKQFDDSKTLNFKVYSSPSVQNFNLNKTELLVGQTASATASATSGSGNYLYRYVVTTDGTVVFNSDFSSANTMNFTPANAGSYVATLYVKDALSQNSFDSQSSSSFTVYNNPVIASYTSSASQVHTGQRLDFSAQGLSGSGNYQYKFVVLKDWNFVTETQYGTSNCYSYVPATSGSYQVYVYIKDSLGTSYSDMKMLKMSAIDYYANLDISLDKDSTLVSQPVTLSAAGNSGSGLGYLYRYDVFQNGVAVYSRAMSTDTKLSYTPQSSGNYEINVYIKDSTSSRDYDTMKSLKFTAYAIPQITSATSTGLMYQKTPVTITAGILSGSPAGVTMKYQVYYNGLLLEQRDIGSTNSFIYTPDRSGKFSLALYIKDNLSTSSYDVAKRFDLNVLSAPMAVSALPIQYGMKNTDVVTIQNALNKLGYSVGTADSIFGIKTKTGVMNFQKSMLLNATGIVDQTTFNLMNDALIKIAPLQNISY